MNRHLLPLTLACALVLPMATGIAATAAEPPAPATASAWDKTFPRNPAITHRSVTYRNRFGITVAADLYLPPGTDAAHRKPALVVGTPHGGVKEQSAGIYAQTMAERGFVALAFDESYNGESSGEPRHITSPEVFVEDFSAGVDYLGTRDVVDRERIGAIGVCGAGAFAITAAQVDHRIKAIATASMYDIARLNRMGWKDSLTDAQRTALQIELGEQRWRDFEAGEPALTPQFPPTMPESVGDPVIAEFFEYYVAPRGHHPRSIGAFTRTSTLAYMNFPLMEQIASISPRPILFIIGEQANSRYFSEDAYARAAQPKELLVVPGARHIDLYDRTDLIPFDRLAGFFADHLR